MAWINIISIWATAPRIGDEAIIEQGWEAILSDDSGLACRLWAILRRLTGTIGTSASWPMR